MKIGIHFLGMMLAALALAISPAQAQKTKTQLITEVGTNFPNNTSGLITPAITVTTHTDEINSWVDWLTCTGTGGMLYWSSGTPTCLNVGTTGQVLTIVAGAPAWVANSALLTAGTGIAVAAGSPATVSLATINNNFAVANTTGGIAAPSGVSVAASGGLLDSVFGNTAGNTLYRGSSSWLALAPGTNGQSPILSGGLPIYQNVAANVQMFTSSGTWTKPTGFGATAIVFIRCWGGGGSGGVALVNQIATNGFASTGGGAGGGYNEGWVPLASLSSSVTVTVGAGGNAVSLSGSVSSTAGNAGTNSSFGTVLTAFAGGAGGATQNTGANTNSQASGGGAGGIFSAGSNGTAGASSSTTLAGTPNFGNFGYGDNGTGSVAVGFLSFGSGGGGAQSSNAGAGSGSQNSTASLAAYWGATGGGGASFNFYAGGCTAGAAGASKMGGNGGAANCSFSGGATATSGTQPGGGGGAATGSSQSGTTTSGAGAAGECIIAVFDGP